MATAFDYATYGAFKKAGSGVVATPKRLARALGLKNRYLRFMRGVDHDGTVVEIGCGGGEFMGELRAAGFTDVVGVDCSPSYSAPGVIVGDAYGFISNQRDHSLGAIVALDVLEHFEATETAALLKASARKLAADGRILVRVPNGASPLGLPNQNGDVSHRTVLTEVSIAQLAFDAGLQVRCYAEPFAYPRSISAVAGLLMWPIYATMTRAVLAAFGQSPKVLTPNLICVMAHRSQSLADPLR
jgi:SAM-dependent methyltransferase